MPSLTIHAEDNVFLNAGLTGVPLMGSTFYVYPMFPCVDCAKRMVQAGVSQICYTETQDMEQADKKWRESWRWSQELFKESGLVVMRIDAQG